jgi:hypothetical protein
MRIALALALFGFAVAAEGATQSWSFRVWLDGNEVGRHTFTRAESAEGARVVSEARLDVRFLFVTAYRYEHRAEERWRDGCLVSLEARTDDNGARKDVSATPERCTWSFAYWDPGILRAQRLLNAQTGQIVPVRWTDLGTESIPVRGQAIAAISTFAVIRQLALDLPRNAFGACGLPFGTRTGVEKFERKPKPAGPK